MTRRTTVTWRQAETTVLCTSEWPPARSYMQARALHDKRRSEEGTFVPWRIYRLKMHRREAAPRGSPFPSAEAFSLRTVPCHLGAESVPALLRPGAGWCSSPFTKHGAGAGTGDPAFPEEDSQRRGRSCEAHISPARTASQVPYSQQRERKISRVSIRAADLARRRLCPLRGTGEKFC